MKGGKKVKKKLFALFLGTSLVLAACGGGNDNSSTKTDDNGNATTTANAGDAAKLFQNKCSACHGQDLTGGVGPNLTKVGSKLSKDQIATILKDGKTGKIGTMPGGLLNDSETSQMAKWLAEKK